MGEPNNKWILWVKWLAAVATIFGIAAATGYSQDSNMQWFGIVLMLIVYVKHKPVTQCFTLRINNQIIHIKLYLDGIGRVWIINQSTLDKKQSKLGFFYNLHTWYKYSVCVNGEEFPLLILSNPFPQGFIVGKGSQSFKFEIIKNSMCF